MPFLVGEKPEKMSEKNKDMCWVEFQPQGKRVQVARGTTVLEAADKAGLPLASDCGGNGRCGRCRIRAVSGEVSRPEPDERTLIEHKQFFPDERLACRTRIMGDAKIQVPASSMRGRQVLLLDGNERPAEAVDPISCLEARLDPPCLSDQRSDLRRLFDALELPAHADFQVHPQFVGRLSKLIRSSEGSLTVFLRDGVPIGLGEPRSVPYGLAFDIGTTSIAGRLLGLSTGEQVASAGVMNPQIPLGEDVISRLNYALHGREKSRELASLLRNAVNDLAEQLCGQGEISPLLVTDVAICANTAISHLLLELPVTYLAKAPYVAGFSTPLRLAATDLGLDAVPCSRVTIMPCIQGFVGGDHVAMILACDIDQAKDTVIGIDIGTNTEIVLAKPGPNGGLFVASCASGPALEGAHIRDGMRASPGAIERVRIIDQEPKVKTIGNEAPVGICGSGIIDTIAELIRARLIDDRGHLKKAGKGIKNDSTGTAYQLVPAEKSGSDDDIIITQKDISEIQLAKAAIHAGVQTILEKTGTPLEQVSSIYLAGAFGSHLNVGSALTIGLLPQLPEARFIQAGNAASVGAFLALLSKKMRNRASRIARDARSIELAGDPTFSSLFAQALRFTTEED